MDGKKNISKKSYTPPMCINFHSEMGENFFPLVANVSKVAAAVLTYKAVKAMFDDRAFEPLPTLSAVE